MKTNKPTIDTTDKKAQAVSKKARVFRVRSRLRAGPELTIKDIDVDGGTC